jgi:hypothetical protein
MLPPNGSMMKHVFELYCTIVPLAETLEISTSHSNAFTDRHKRGIRVVGTLVWTVCMFSFVSRCAEFRVLTLPHTPSSKPSESIREIRN